MIFLSAFDVAFDKAEDATEYAADPAALRIPLPILEANPAKSIELATFDFALEAASTTLDVRLVALVVTVLMSNEPLTRGEFAALETSMPATLGRVAAWLVSLDVKDDLALVSAEVPLPACVGYRLGVCDVTFDSFVPGAKEFNSYVRPIPHIIIRKRLS